MIAQQPSTLVDVLQAHRFEAAVALMQNVLGWEKYDAGVRAWQATGDPALPLEMIGFVDCLRDFLATGDRMFRSLCIYQKLRQTYEPDISSQALRARRLELGRADAAALKSRFGPLLSSAEADRLEATLEDIFQVVQYRLAPRLRTLFIGDCLYTEIFHLMLPECVEDGIGLDPTFFVSRNPSEVRRQIAEAGPFDLIFYSPFTYRFAPDLDGILEPQPGILSEAGAAALVERVMAEVTLTVDLLVRRFEVPIFIHNAVLVRRHDGSAAEVAIAIRTRQARELVRRLLNQRLADYLETLPGHVFLLDEMPLLEEYGEMRLARKFYDTDHLHPTWLGRFLSREVLAAVRAYFFLRGRKLIMCDLDNTLWEGVAGEGEVRHFESRQRCLRRLRDKGVLLAISSKNESRSVSWENGVLNAQDFVHAEINWDPKATHVGRIEAALDLKASSFVFIDDRPDERELMRLSHADVRVLDATSVDTWGMLERWAQTLTPPADGDRTRQYHERTQRQQFLQTAPPTVEHDALLATLDLRVAIERAAPDVLERLTELINRTNQFNMTGRRIARQQLETWQQAPDHEVWAVRAADRFGDTGTIAAVVLQFVDDHRIEIPVFVLSCRVFGYHIEHAIINRLKRLALPPRHLVGWWKPTGSNDFCRWVYRDQGFVQGEAGWTWQGDQVPADAAWLRVAP
ncbi:MAG TPA: HAD-IIIC family phosphatase [Candidatus Xenobia bacterium]